MRNRGVFIGITTVFALVLAFEAKAEYRVFLLKIENTQTKEVRMVQSNLDPLQYPRYFTVLPTEQVSYSETWRCFGRTSDFTEYCPNPKAQPKDENSSNTP